MDGGAERFMKRVGELSTGCIYKCQKKITSLLSFVGGFLDCFSGQSILS